MRWYGQLVVIAALGAAGYGGWYAWREGHLAKVPVVGEYVASFAPPGSPRQAGGPGGPGRGGGGPPPVVDVDGVKTGRIVETREAVGTVRAYESIMVTAKGFGHHPGDRFDEGQKVNAGDVLVRFDTDERRADIEAAIAEIRRAEAQRNEIRTRLERARRCAASAPGTAAQVEDLTAQVRTLESAIASAEARRKAAEARLEDLIIRAPFDGRLGTRSVSLGAYVSPGTRITTLDDLSRVRLDFSVPENVLAHLQAGQPVRAVSAAFGERVFEGRVALIDPRVDPVTRAVRLTAEFHNSDEALKPGMFLAVTLEVTNKENAVVVPEEAIVSEGLRHLVFVVKDNVIERRVVSIGQRQGSGSRSSTACSPARRSWCAACSACGPAPPSTPQPIGAEALAGAQRRARPRRRRHIPSLPPAGAGSPGQRRRGGAARLAFFGSGSRMQVSDLFIRRPVFSVVVSLLLDGRRACRAACSCRCASTRRSIRRSSPSTRSIKGAVERGHREPHHRAVEGAVAGLEGIAPDHLAEPERALVGHDRVLPRPRSRRRRRRRPRPRRPHHGAPARGRRPARRAQGRRQRRRDHVDRRHLRRRSTRWS